MREPICQSQTMEQMDERFSAILTRFRRVARGQDKEGLTGGDWRELAATVSERCPRLRQTVSRAEPPLRLEEWRLCLLVWLEFTPTEAAALLGVSAPHVTMLRRRLCVKVFGCNGSAREFDRRVMEMKSLL